MTICASDAYHKSHPRSNRIKCPEGQICGKVKNLPEKGIHCHPKIRNQNTPPQPAPTPAPTPSPAPAPAPAPQPQSRKCSRTHPPPPCPSGQTARIKTYKNGKQSNCCYKGKLAKVAKSSSKSKSKSQSKSDSKFFDTHKTLMEFNAPDEIRDFKKLSSLFSKSTNSTDGLFVSEKMDGHRMLFDYESGGIALSRSGKTRFKLPEDWKQALLAGGMTLDGEIFLHGLPASKVAALRTATDEAKNYWDTIAEYHVFDAPLLLEDFTSRIASYSEAVAKICAKWQELYPESTSCPIKAAPQTLCKSAEDAQKVFEHIMQKSYTYDGISQPAEGVVLAKPNGKYEFRSSSQKIKYKQRYEGDCIVIKPHDFKSSLKVYRADCDAPGSPKAAIFNISTEGVPPHLFSPGDLLKYTCLGFGKGNDDCPNVPKMAKLKDFRSEDMKTAGKEYKKIKLPPAPKDGPNEDLAKYFLQVGKKYFEKKDTARGIAYNNAAARVRRTLLKIDTKDKCQMVLGGKSMGQQCVCVVEELEKEIPDLIKCADGRL